MTHILLAFGIVWLIPLAAYPATREQKISFKQLRNSDLSPIRHQKTAEAGITAPQISFRIGRYSRGCRPDRAGA